MQSLLILGRQTEIGLAELRSLYGDSVVSQVGSQAALVDVDPCLLAFDRLGGSIKFCKVLTTLDTTDWRAVEKFLLGVAPGQAASMPEGKMLLGLSLYDFNETLARITATGLNIKKAIRKSGRSVRLVPNKTTDLNSAQVIHNKLLTPNGWELVFIKNGSQTIVAQTVKVQDIEAYTKRDRERPARDSRVGMLPPKLAQIIINLAAGQLPTEELKNICDIPAGQPIPYSLLNQTVLDPFCGTGVVLQEAALMGYHVMGTDLEPRMINYSQRNLDWLNENHQLTGLQTVLEAGDATNFTWTSQPDIVAAETYLGRPFTSEPNPEILAQTISECNLIIRKSLQNLHNQLRPGTRLCLAVPAWHIGNNQPKLLPLTDQLFDLGFDQVMGSEPALIYHRPGQVVGRQLLVLVSR